MIFNNKPALNSDGSVPASYYDDAYWEKGAESGKGSYNGNSYDENIEACKIWAQDCYNRWGPFESFLELGCGRAWNIYGFIHLPELGIQKMMGVDFSHYAVETSNEKVKPFLIENGISDLSFLEDRSFDLIFSNDVLEHLTRAQVVSCLTHCYRITKKKMAHLISIGDGKDIPDGEVPSDQDQSHITLKSAAWWLEMFNLMFRPDGWIVNFVDRGRTIEIVVERRNAE